MKFRIRKAAIHQAQISALPTAISSYSPGVNLILAKGS